MNPKIIIVQNVPFAELIAFEDLQTSNSIFDIITTKEINENSYCCALINKVFDLNPSKFSEFISYQTTQVKDNIKWLNKFEKLLTVNENLFTTNGNYTRLTKLINLIEKKRELLQSSSIKPPKPALAKKYINAENDDRYFSFYELKKQLELFDNDDDKILLLTREKHEYKQANIEFINRNTPIFDEQCRQEIEQIYELQKLKVNCNNSKSSLNNTPVSFNKIQFNCNVNQFVDIFYQLNRVLFVDGKPIIDSNTNDLIAMIVNSFVDKDKNEISPQTVETILKPSREEKRPKAHKRIDIDKLL